MDIVEELRPYRKALVEAAEQVAPSLFREGGQGVTKAQLSHLIAVCADGECTAEIDNYLRYQAGRKSGGWTVPIVDGTIKAVGEVLAKLPADEAQRTKAWHLFAVFLARAFRYRDAVAKAAQENGGGAPRAPGGRGRPNADGGRR